MDGLSSNQNVMAGELRSANPFIEGNLDKSYFRNVDGWNSRGGKSQRRESKKKEDQRRKAVERCRKKIKTLEKDPKGRKVANHCCSNVSGLRRVDRGLAKVAGLEQILGQGAAEMIGERAEKS